MISLKEVFVNKPTFGKVASKDLPKNSMEWNDSILQQFYTDVPYIDPNFMVDPVITDGDDKQGYGKGSIVVTNNGRKINFPIIIKDWKLSPFDVFVKHEGDNDEYIPANQDNINKSLIGESVGEISDYNEYYQDNSVKRPGGITPKQATSAPSIPTQASFGVQTNMKLAFDWHATVHEDDLIKFAEEIDKTPEIKEAFVENGTGVVSRIINEAGSKRVELQDKMNSKIDVGNIVVKKARDTVIDSKLFNVNMLKPITKTPSHVQVRARKFPKMEDVIQSGVSPITRLTSIANGYAINGVVYNIKDHRNEGNIDKKLFISDDGKYYAVKSEMSGQPAFFGVDLPLKKEAFDSLIRRTADVTTDELPILATSSADKQFPEAGGVLHTDPDKYKCEEIAFIYGQGDEWEAIYCNGGAFKKRIVNGREVYLNKGKAFIKAGVAKPVPVDSVDDPIYGIALGQRKMCLIPETTIVVNLSMIECIKGVLVSPDKTPKDVLNESGVEKIAMSIGDKGFKIDGAPADSIKKIAGLKPWDELDVKSANTILETVGMTKQAADEAIRTLVKSASDGRGNLVTVYGVTSDYINAEPILQMEKEAVLKPMLREYALSIRSNLIKEAAVIDDPEVVDNVLSTNFINEDNINDFVENIDKLEKVNSKLAELLVAARMGLKDVDEMAIKKAIEGLNKTIEGLNKLKLVATSNA